MGWENRDYHREERGSSGIPPVQFAFPRPTPLTLTLILTCLGLFIIQASTRSSAFLEYWGTLTLVDGLAFKQPWRWITYQYLHVSAGHFFFNMIALYFFLPSLEQRWGWRKALGFYTLGGIAAGVVYAVLAGVFGLSRFAYLLGASGSVLAAMGAVALFYPARQLILLIFPVPIRVAVALFAAYYTLSAFADQNLSNAAHLGGLAFGFFAPYLAGPVLEEKTVQWKKRRKQAVVRSEIDEQAEVDRILAKVAAKGMNSLTGGEKKALQRATERQRQAELQRAKRIY